jgi:hypothetical protein
MVWRSGRGAVEHVRLRRGGVRLGQLRRSGRGTVRFDEFWFGCVTVCLARRSGHGPVWTGSVSWGQGLAVKLRSVEIGQVRFGLSSYGGLVKVSSGSVR